MSTKVEELINDIKVNLSQRSSSIKDEARVMQEMLNDKDYVVGVYDKSGKVGEYCPSESARKIVTNVLTSGAKISVAEAKAIADKYEFSRPEATEFISISKEFINTYLQTGRKLPLGNRSDMGTSLVLKSVKAQTKNLPNNKGEIIIPAYNTIKTQGGCPKHLKG